LSQQQAIELTEISKTYRTMLPWARRETTAVDSLSLAVPRGEIFGLLGPNGAGKTTTIKIIADLIVPDAGRVTFPCFRGRPRIGAVLEGSRNLYWRLSAWENIRYFGELKGIGMASLNKQAGELLELFGIAHKARQPAQTLSRGMQQKLAVVLAFLGEPQVLLLDEPTLGLDVASSVAIQRLLRQLCRERNLTIIITTHQMDVAQSLCRRVGIMRDGRVVACEPVSQLVDHFRRQDYVVRLGETDWATIGGDSRFAFEQLPEERPGQVSVRYKLETPNDVYPLVRMFEEHGIELLDFRQETPTLEDIFLSITGDGPDGEAGR
jgi:ABC-2 type transport system ATP-binding protein